MSHLHRIDKHSLKWTNEELEMLFIFCILDRATTYEKVCKAFDLLMDKYWRGTIRHSFFPKQEKEVAQALKGCGYRFYNQAIKHILANTWISSTYLRNCSRRDMIKDCLGIGYKLASMFLRNTRGANYAVIDTHILWFLGEAGVNVKLPYPELERKFLYLAKQLDKTAYELDMEIWQSRRR